MATRRRPQTLLWAQPGATTCGREAFRDPASIAVVGASDDPGTWGYWLDTGVSCGPPRLLVYPVNRRALTVRGRPALASVGELPEPAELVAIYVPGPDVFGGDGSADHLAQPVSGRNAVRLSRRAP